MSDVLTIGLAGFAASFVDGSLGMGFGLTSSSILLATGISPASAATTVNIAKVATGLTGAASHWRLGNIDRRLVFRLAWPGAIGAAIGAYVLSAVDGSAIRPWLALLLLALGVRLLVRFAQPVNGTVVAQGRHRHGPRGTVEVVATAGGITNGMIGAWGPVVTPSLLHRGLSPRLVVGSVNTAEVAVAVVAVGSLFSAASPAVSLSTLAAMLIGGVIASPLAAWSVRHIPAQRLGLGIAGMLLLTNVRELSNWLGIDTWRWAAYAVVAAAVGAAAVAARRSTIARPLVPRDSRVTVP